MNHNFPFLFIFWFINWQLLKPQVPFHFSKVSANGKFFLCYLIKMDTSERLFYHMCLSSHSRTRTRTLIYFIGDHMMKDLGMWKALCSTSCVAQQSPLSKSVLFHPCGPHYLWDHVGRSWELDCGVWTTCRSLGHCSLCAVSPAHHGYASLSSCPWPRSVGPGLESGRDVTHINQGRIFPWF